MMLKESSESDCDMSGNLKLSPISSSLLSMILPRALWSWCHLCEVVVYTPCKQITYLPPVIIICESNHYGIIQRAVFVHTVVGKQVV